MRAAAVIDCPLHCGWCARHVADTTSEVVEFLKKVRDAHVIAEHPSNTYVTPGEAKAYVEQRLKKEIEH